MSDDRAYPPVSPLFAGLMCRCPRCGKGKLFRGFLGLPERCETCGLDYAFVDAGDGPAVFIILIAGFIVVGSALLVEVTYQPPFWEALAAKAAAAAAAALPCSSSSGTPG